MTEEKAQRLADLRWSDREIWHEVLDDIFDSGSLDAIAAVQANLKIYRTIALSARAGRRSQRGKSAELEVVRPDRAPATVARMPAMTN